MVGFLERARRNGFYAMKAKENEPRARVCVVLSKRKSALIGALSFSTKNFSIHADRAHTLPATALLYTIHPV